MTTPAPAASLAKPQPAGVQGSGALRRLGPGVLLCAAIAALAAGIGRAEEALLGRDWLEPVVLAILLGTALRTAWTPPKAFAPGIAFSAKVLLEVAIILLGTALSAQAILAVGPALVLGIAAVVAVAIPASYGIGRLLGLPRRMAMLVACGNSICGNSAIAAVAPVIGAESRDIAASIAFTAVLGIVVVLSLPLAVPLLGLHEAQYGVLAGLTVYAVPQVLAATAPVGALSVQLGTLVKLVRVLMLGPVVLVLSLLSARRRDAAQPAARPRVLGRLVPWFILGFLGCAVLRSLGLIPQAALAPIASLTTLLTVVSMAALGLGVDVRMVARAGAPVVAAVIGSLLVLGAISLGLIHLLPLA
ncbi:putative membrane spanning protein [Roseomonas mucosa]|uniref:Sulfate exporter family transporter n=1 Tax=Roseomonas mucosa TaxID=207340 RepID=A0A379N297_9PROT|nr:MULTISPECIES: putative sulfate exporter family transporter [Roseomonas]MBS5902596.1 putative sulfate exporter family transporter [Acetobacteraceae bacterium]MCG7353890.1 putative sulfate exporter family transporter [Roseomonas mucosa]MCG7359049.1 putative sulfate exporter family transporter [Roseomonas mucosa]MDT8290888.1 putative sulfate exporter family transporter [Roseomonas mucosa]MDT8295784.1 putative sulfate exporter family transporter [Roseomonas mucosa]